MVGVVVPEEGGEGKVGRGERERDWEGGLQAVKVETK